MTAASRARHTAGRDPATPDLRWFSVRCVLQHRGGLYEERITLWRARDVAHAIELAEAEAAEYAAALPPTSYTGLAQAHQLDDEPGAGTEVFSLMRSSELAPAAYLDRFFDTGDEREGDV